METECYLQLFQQPDQPNWESSQPTERFFLKEHTKLGGYFEEHPSSPDNFHIHTCIHAHPQACTHRPKFKKKRHRRVDRKIAEYFGALDTIVEDLGSVLSIHMTTYKQSTDLVLQAIMPYYCSHENQACTWYPKYIEAKYTK